MLAGVDDADDEDTSLAGVHDKDTSLAGVPVPNTTIMTNADDDSDAESDHNSIDPNKADDNSSKACSLKAGINKFGDQAKASAHKEMKQLHDRSCFRPVDKCLLDKFEKQRAMESLLFLTEKRDKMIKSQHCANGSTQHAYIY